MKEKITAKIDTDDYDFEPDFFQEDLQQAVDNFKTCSNSGVFIMTGTAGLWHGDYKYAPYVISLNNFLTDIYQGDRMVYTFYEKRLEVTAHHHDGVNQYTLTPIESYTKKQLLNEYINDNTDKNHFTSDFEKPVSRAIKAEIIEYIEQYYM